MPREQGQIRGAEPNPIGDLPRSGEVAKPPGGRSLGGDVETRNPGIAGEAQGKYGIGRSVGRVSGDRPDEKAEIRAATGGNTQKEPGETSKETPGSTEGTGITVPEKGDVFVADSSEHSTEPQQTQESGGRIILPTDSPPDGTNQPPLVHGERANIPDEVTVGYTIEETPSGLTVVTDKPHEKGLITASDIPNDTRDESSEKEQRVPMEVWLTSPDGALLRLGRETENETAVALIKTTSLKDQMIGREIADVAKNAEPDTDPLGQLQLSQINKTLTRLSQQDYTEAEREMIADQDPAFPMSMSDIEVKLKLPEEIATQFEKDEYSQEQKQQMKQGADAYFAEVIKDTNALPQIVPRLTNLADTLRFQTKSIQLPGNQTIEAIVQVSETAEAVTPELIDFLTRFDIPPSLAGELLPKLEQAGQLTHPLAWHLLDKVPDEHPFKVDQRNRVSRLTELLTGEITDLQLYEALKIRDGIISIHVDPDHDPHRDKVGLEFENLPLIDAVAIPPGTTMGQDVGSESIPELRLDNQDDVLLFGKNWRQRYYQIHLWTQIAQAAGASLHIHINNNPQIDPQLYKLLFGYDDKHVMENELGTIEIKGTLLSGTDKKMTEGRRGFSSEYMPELVELIYSLRQAEARPIELSALQADRFTFFTKTIEDPFSRAAMLVALRSDAGLRVTNPKSLYEEMYGENGELKSVTEITLNHLTAPEREQIVHSAVATGSRNLLLHLAENVSALPPSLQRIITEEVLDKKNKDAMHILTWKIDELADPLHEPLVTEIIGTKDYQALTPLALRIGSLEASLQQKVMNEITSSKNKTVNLALQVNVESLEPSLQKQFLDWITSADNTVPPVAIAERLGSIRRTLQKEFVDWAKQAMQPDILSKLGENADSLDPSIQKELADWAIQNKSRTTILALGTVAGRLDDSQDLPEKIVDEILSNYRQDIFKLLIDVKSYTPSQRERVVAKALKDPASSVLWKLASNIEFIEPEQREQIFIKVIETNDGAALRTLAENIGTLEPAEQEIVIDESIETNNQHAIVKLAQHIGGLQKPQQEAVFSSAVDLHDASLLKILADNTSAIDVPLRRKLAAAIKEYGSYLFYKAASCNLDNWEYSPV